jgi:hypothetical protein
MDRFNSLVQETYQLSEDEYLQKTKNTQDQTYSLIYRENGRYSEPVELTHGVENPEDIEQLVIGGTGKRRHRTPRTQRTHRGGIRMKVTRRLKQNILNHPREWTQGADLFKRHLFDFQELMMLTEYRTTIINTKDNAVVVTQKPRTRNKVQLR